MKLNLKQISTWTAIALASPAALWADGPSARRSSPPQPPVYEESATKLAATKAATGKSAGSKPSVSKSGAVKSVSAHPGASLMATPSSRASTATNTASAPDGSDVYAAAGYGSKGYASTGYAPVADATQMMTADLPDGGCAHCGDLAGGDCPDCGGVRSWGVWGSVEYLLLWQTGRDLPPLVTTDPNAGALPTATVLFGNETIGDSVLSAGRVTAGLWLDSQDTLGAAFRFLGTESERTGFSVASDANGVPLIGRPFTNTQFFPTPSALLVASPGFLSGSVDVTTSSDFYSGEALGRVNLDADDCSRLDLIGGYHTLLLDDGLTIRNQAVVVGGNLPIGTRFNVLDDFNTRNEFHGGSIGVWYDSYRGPWTVSAMAKVSIGSMLQQVRVRGASQAVDAAGGTTDYVGGLLASRTNIGDFERRETTYVPEINLTLSRQLTKRLEFTMGYTFIYLSSVVLAGDQIDLNVNSAQLFGGAILPPQDPRPPQFDDKEYFVHGLSFGLNYRF